MILIDRIRKYQGQSEKIRERNKNMEIMRGKLINGRKQNAKLKDKNGNIKWKREN